jgi:hypothetical protein
MSETPGMKSPVRQLPINGQDTSLRRTSMPSPLQKASVKPPPPVGGPLDPDRA